MVAKTKLKLQSRGLSSAGLMRTRMFPGHLKLGMDRVYFTSILILIHKTCLIQENGELLAAARSIESLLLHYIRYSEPMESKKKPLVKNRKMIEKEREKWMKLYFKL